jgi:hypothetical protein
MYKCFKTISLVLLLCVNVTSHIIEGADKHIEKDFIIECKPLGQTIHISPSTMPHSCIEDAQKFVNASGFIPFEGHQILFPLLKSILLAHVALKLSGSTEYPEFCKPLISALLYSKHFQNKIWNNPNKASQAMRVINRYAHLFCCPDFTTHLLDKTIKLVAQSWASSDGTNYCHCDSLNHEYHEKLARYYYLARNTSKNKPINVSKELVQFKTWHLRYTTNAKNKLCIEESLHTLTETPNYFWNLGLDQVYGTDLLLTDQTGSIFMQDPESIEFTLASTPDINSSQDFDNENYKVRKFVKLSEKEKTYSVRLLTKIDDICQLPALVKSILDNPDYQDYTMEELLISFNTFKEQDLITALQGLNLEFLKAFWLSNPGIAVGPKSINLLSKLAPNIKNLCLTGTPDEKMTIANDVYGENNSVDILHIEFSQNIPQDFLQSFKNATDITLDYISEPIEYPFESERLEHLILSHLTFNNDAFLHCPNLVTLTITDTQLKSLSIEILKGAPLLQELDVSNNNLEEIPHEFIAWLADSNDEIKRILIIENNPFNHKWLSNLTGKQLALLFGDKSLKEIFDNAQAAREQKEIVN